MPIQFEDWGIAHTMTIARRYLHLQEQFGLDFDPTAEILLAEQSLQ